MNKYFYNFYYLFHCNQQISKTSEMSKSMISFNENPYYKEDANFEEK